MCCVCLVALASFAIWRGGMLDNQPPVILDDSIIIGEKDYINPYELDNSSHTSTPSDKEPSVENDVNQHLWTINRVDGCTGAAKLNFSSDEYDSEKKTLDDITHYLGRDLSTLDSILSKGFEFFGKNETDFFYKLSGELVYDTCVFGYKKGDQQITILVSKIGVPYDCIYKLNDPDVSEINGVEVTMGGIYKADNSGEFDLVFADFSHEGLQYRVTVENVNFDDEIDMPTRIVGIVAELTK